MDSKLSLSLHLLQEWYSLEHDLLSSEVPIPVYFALEGPELVEIHERISESTERDKHSSVAGSEPYTHLHVNAPLCIQSHSMDYYPSSSSTHTHPLWLLFASPTRTVKERERERESSSLLVNLTMLQTLARHSLF